MMQWITKVYSSPTAQVKVNGILSDPFPIKNRTRQGCPLSPLLFPCLLKRSCVVFRLNPDIKGITAGSQQYKISAYTDDLLFSLTNPGISLPNLMKEFEEYGALSNLKINLNESTSMGIQIAPALLATLKSSFKFKWSDMALKYLGTYIPCNIARTYELNFPSLLTRTRNLLEKWHKGVHSWFGRCNLLKILIPSPTDTDLSFISNRYTQFSSNSYGHIKKPQLSRRYLTLSKRLGGLALPDVRKYFQATHLSRFIDWRWHYKVKLWAQLEQSQTNRHPSERCPVVLRLTTPDPPSPSADW